MVKSGGEHNDEEEVFTEKEKLRTNVGACVKEGALGRRNKAKDRRQCVTKGMVRFMIFCNSAAHLGHEDTKKGKSFLK